jgi:hypothetical protein
MSFRSIANRYGPRSLFGVHNMVTRARHYRVWDKQFKVAYYEVINRMFRGQKKEKSFVNQLTLDYEMSVNSMSV